MGAGTPWVENVGGLARCRVLHTDRGRQVSRRETCKGVSGEKMGFAEGSLATQRVGTDQRGSSAAARIPAVWSRHSHGARRRAMAEPGPRSGSSNARGLGCREETRLGTPRGGWGAGWISQRRRSLHTSTRPRARPDSRREPTVGRIEPRSALPRREIAEKSEKPKGKPNEKPNGRAHGRPRDPHPWTDASVSDPPPQLMTRPWRLRSSLLGGVVQAHWRRGVCRIWFAARRGGGAAGTGAAGADGHRDG